MVYQPRKTFIHLRNTNEDIFLLNSRDFHDACARIAIFFNYFSSVLAHASWKSLELSSQAYKEEKE